MMLADWYRVVNVSTPAVSPDGKRVAVTVTKAVEGLVGTLMPTSRPRMAGDGLYGGYSRPLVDAWDERDQ